MTNATKTPSATTTKKAEEPKRIPAISVALLARGTEDAPEPFGLTFRSADGDQRTITLGELSAMIQQFCGVHGLKQKVIDAAAISRNPETGRSATVQDKWAAAMKVADRLIAGAWNAPSEGGGNAGGLLFKALCRMQPAKTPEAIKEWLDGKDDKQKTALRANPKVAAIIAELQAEAGKASGVDSDALLGELDATAEE